MLRMDAYSVMDGLMVRFAGFNPDRNPSEGGENGASVTRLVRSEIIEQIGLDQALRDVFVDVAQEYPGLLGYALR